MDWFRLYSKIKQNYTIQALPLICFKCYINILCEANDAEDRGFIKDAKQVAYLLRIKPSKMDEILLRLESDGLMIRIEDGRWTPANWDKYQMASDNSAGRVAKHRSKTATIAPVLSIKTHTENEDDGAVAGRLRKVDDDFFRDRTATDPFVHRPMRSESHECNVTVTPLDRDKKEIRIDNTIPLPTLSEKSPQKKERTINPFQVWFDNCFWPAYPRKDAKPRALAAVIKIAPDEEKRTAILEGIERTKKTEKWRRNNGDYIPYASTWLTACGWEDQGVVGMPVEPPSSSGNSGGRNIARPDLNDDPAQKYRDGWLNGGVKYGSA